MWSPCVVEGQIPGQAFACDRDTVIAVQVDLFVFDGSPEPFYEDVVAPGPLAIYYRQCIAKQCHERHADLDVCILQRLDEVDGCELASLDALLTVKCRIGSVDFEVSFSEAIEDFTGDISFQAADRFEFGTSLRQSLCHVGLCCWVQPYSANSNDVKGAVCSAISASIQSMALDFS
jgi:hypothetical protein